MMTVPLACKKSFSWFAALEASFGLSFFERLMDAPKLVWGCSKQHWCPGLQRILASLKWWNNTIASLLGTSILLESLPCGGYILTNANDFRCCKIHRAECNKDYTKILTKAKKGDFCFLDPPYIEEHKYDFQYNLGEKLDKGFLKELQREVAKLDKRGVRWLMTQADTPEIRRLFKPYKIEPFRVYRNKTKQYKNELLIRNY